MSFYSLRHGKTESLECFFFMVGLPPKAGGPISNNLRILSMCSSEEPSGGLPKSKKNYTRCIINSSACLLVMGISRTRLHSSSFEASIAPVGFSNDQITKFDTDILQVSIFGGVNLTCFLEASLSELDLC